MDRITKQLLNDFLTSQEISENNESNAFEQFCNYTILSNEYNKTFDVNSITVGSGGDTAIDGIAIIVNGHLIEDVDEIDDLLSSNGSLDVTYIFIQSKTSSNFDTHAINAFYFGVSDFFLEKPRLPRNSDVIRYSELSEYLLSKASEFKENPKCKMFYITTGIVNEDNNITAITEASKETLTSYNLFESIEHNILGANELGKLYRKSKNPISAQFVFSNKITLPEVEGIDEAYYGVLPLSEFKKLLVDDNGHIKSVFDDNVRDFQGGNNPVNKSISDTLTGENAGLFSVLNNGVTVVANSIKTSANSLTILDYQIVNGCQTSNVLFENINSNELDLLSIPLRLIVTQNDEVKSKITVSTNNQTAIKKEQLSAMSDFQKNLEHYYSSIEGDGKLYYERRAKQYNSDSTVIKRRIITIPNQIKSYSSMFSKNPHMVTTYFGTLVKKMGAEGSNIFEPDHQFSPYYMAGLAYYKLDTLFISGEIDKRFRKVKFYLTMLVPMIASEGAFPPLNSQRKAEAFCEPIIKKLLDEQKCKRIFEAAVTIIERSGAAIDDKQSLKSKKMTEEIIAAYNNEKV